MTPKVNKRKYKLHLRVPVDSNEEKVIKSQAERCGLSVSAYLKKVAMGYEPKSILVNEKVDELAKINGDLGRLGGLLKLWLSNDERTAAFNKSTLYGLLGKIDDAQSQMVDIMIKIIKS